MVELLVVIALAAAVASIVFVPITFSFKNFALQNKTTSTISDARSAMTYLTSQIRKAENVAVSGNTITADGNVYKIENSALYKNGAPVLNGVDSLACTKLNDAVYIIITAGDFSLTSTINLR